MTFAVIKTGGKQYLVQPGDKLEVELLDDAEPGKEITFPEVLLVGDDKKSQIGTPLVTGAIVTAKVLGEKKGPKLIIFKYKPKKRYKRKIGHRQHFSEVEIIGIK